MPDLRITEIFYSLQGETRTVGLPTVFIRLTGCPLRCSYCDTAYAFEGGSKYSLQAILDEVASYRPHYVTVTGGEPLAQKGCGELLRRLCDQGYEVSLETSGAIALHDIDPRVVIVMDLKSPDSGESARNRYDNLARLGRGDQLKFVLCSRSDYDWAKSMLLQHQRALSDIEILMSPTHGQLSATELAEWILADKLHVRLQLQLHKLLWADGPGR